MQLSTCSGPLQPRKRHPEGFLKSIPRAPSREGRSFNNQKAYFEISFPTVEAALSSFSLTFALIQSLFLVISASCPSPRDSGSKTPVPFASRMLF